jgi:precorrin-3B synthase
MRMLEAIARHGREARARDIIATDGIFAFRSAVGELAISARSRQGGDQKPDTRLRGKKSPLDPYRLGDGSFACGIGLAFGSAHASMLERLAEAAREAGAIGVRAAPGRALLAIGLAPAKLSLFTTAAEKLGFIVDAGDARRSVIACAGAPLCASGHIAARAMAPGIAELTAAHRDPSFTIHVSGCVKGCAHPGAAALTIVGTPGGCALIRNGSPRDAPFATAAAETLAPTIAAMIGAPLREAGHA